MWSSQDGVKLPEASIDTTAPQCDWSPTGSRRCGALVARRLRRPASLRPVSSSALRSSKSTRPSRQRQPVDGARYALPLPIKPRRERTAGVVARPSGRTSGLTGPPLRGMPSHSGCRGCSRSHTPSTHGLPVTRSTLAHSAIPDGSLGPNECRSRGSRGYCATVVIGCGLLNERTLLR